MQLPNAKELAKLANACRKAGIKSFKGAGIEFTLTDEAPVKNTKKTAAAVAQDTQGSIESDEPGYEQLLHWSIAPMDEEKATDQ